MKPFRLGLGQRLAFAFAAVFIVVFIFVAIFLIRNLEQRALRDLGETMTTQARVFSEFYQGVLHSESDAGKLQARVAGFGEALDARLTLIDASGKVIGDSQKTFEGLRRMDNHSSRPEVMQALAEGQGSSVRYSHSLKTDMLYVAVPLVPGETPGGVVRIALPVTRVGKMMSSIRRPILIGSLTGCVIVIGVGLLIGLNLTRRISQMTNAASRYGRGDFSEKIHIDSSDEFRVLAETMNQMAGSLETRIHEIENEKTKVAAIIDNMTEGVIAIDHLRQILMVNPCIENIFGVREAQAYGKSLIEVFKHQRLDDMAEEAINLEMQIEGEIELMHGERTLRVNAVGLPEREDEEVRGILVLHDVTEIKKLENLRRDFVANVSHELRTPLTSVKGFIETLLAGALNDRKQSEKFLGMMEADTDRLTRLIDDVLTISKIESKAVRLQREDFMLDKEISAVLDGLRKKIEAKKIRIENRIKPDAVEVWADRDKVRQILVNLLDNAVKFTDEGGRIALDAVGKERFFTISVADTGAGIPAEAIPRIFERFFRVDKARDRDHGGTGLGLSIVKHLSEIMGGSVTCESVLNEGSTFSFTLPGA